MLDGSVSVIVAHGCSDWLFDRGVCPQLARVLEYHKVRSPYSNIRDKIRQQGRIWRFAKRGTENATDDKVEVQVQKQSTTIIISPKKWERPIGFSL